MSPCYSMGNMDLSVVYPSEETVEKAKEAIHETMYPLDNTMNKDQQETTQTETTTQTESTAEPAEDNQ